MLLPNYIHTNKNSTLQRITLGHSHYDPSRLHNTIYFILTPCHMANKLACSYQLAHATSAYGGSLLGSAWQNNQVMKNQTLLTCSSATLLAYMPLIYHQYHVMYFDEYTIHFLIILFMLEKFQDDQRSIIMASISV